MEQTSRAGTFFGGAPHRSRSWAAVAASSAVHAAAIAAAMTVVRGATPPPQSQPRAERSLMFVRLRSAHEPVRLARVKLVRLPPLTAEKPKTEDPAPIRVAPAPGTRVTPVAHVEPAPTPPESRRELPKPVEPAKPAVTVGAFASDGRAAHVSALPRPVEHAGLDAPAARAPDTKIATAKVGAFDPVVSAARPQPGSDRAKTVTDAGFGAAPTVQRSEPSAAPVADAGFGSAAEAAPKSSTRGAVQLADFDARPTPAIKRAPGEVRIDTPVEILSKPTPEYTEEARKLKIEGDVLLEVDFAATGELRVKRVVRGLGHGLDEAATRAALGMRFKPALANGRPVDFRTTVHILFRLA